MTLICGRFISRVIGYKPIGQNVRTVTILNNRKKRHLQPQRESSKPCILENGKFDPNIHNNNNNKTLSQRFHDAILDYASHNNGLLQPLDVKNSSKSKLKLPNYIKQISDPEVRFRTILEDGIEISETHLLELYDPLHGSLSPRSATLFSIHLYKLGEFSKCCKVLLENLSLGGRGDILSTLAYQVIPTLCQEGPNQAESQELALGNICYTLAVQLQQIPMALQLCQELGKGNQELVIQDMPKLCRLSEEIFNRDITTSSAFSRRIEKVFGQKFPQVIMDNDRELWTRLEILNLYTRIESPHRDLSKTLAGIEELFVKEPFFFQGLIRNQLNQYQNDKISDESFEKNSRSIGLFLSRECKSVLNYKDLESFCELGYTKEKFPKVWKYLKKYYDRNDIMTITNDDDDAYIKPLTKFLQQALRYQQTFAIVNIIKHGQGRFSQEQISLALEQVMWAKRNNKKINDDSLYYDPSDIDTQLVEDLVNSLPTSKILEEALLTVLKRLQTSRKKKGIPGRILWNLLLGIQNSSTYIGGTYSVERQLASILTRRPHFEQMRYMSLEKTSYNGIMVFLRQYICSKQYIRDSNRDELGEDADAKLILAGITLASEKNSNSSTTSVPSNNAILSPLVVDLFRDWQGEKAVRMIELLYSQKIQPSDEIIVRSVSMLLNQEEYKLAFRLMTKVHEIPDEVYFKFLIKSSFGFPYLAYRLTTFLINTQKKQIPSEVLRRMIIGYSKSTQLTDSQSARFIWRNMRIIRRQNNSRYGKRAAESLVESVLKRAEIRGWGSRKRLQWALEVARKEGIGAEKARKWMARLDDMRTRKTGYWSRGYYHRPKFY